MKIHINRKHIEEAVVKDSHHCMIADAIKSRNPDAQYISVDLQTIKFTSAKTGERFTFLTPPRAQINLVKFDQGTKTIEPFSFDLNAPVIIRNKSRNARSGKPRSHKRKYTKSGKNKGRVVTRERQFGLRMYKG